MPCRRDFKQDPDRTGGFALTRVQARVEKGSLTCLSIHIFPWDTDIPLIGLDFFFSLDLKLILVFLLQKSNVLARSKFSPKRTDPGGGPSHTVSEWVGPELGPPRASERMGLGKRREAGGDVSRMKGLNKAPGKLPSALHDPWPSLQ